jgi:hypothetical protein
MGKYLRALPSLRVLHDQMLRTRGSCKWWRCHNVRRNGTFLMNAEAYLGFHLRWRIYRTRPLVALANTLNPTSPSRDVSAHALTVSRTDRPSARTQE